jgi:hypothetical protein
MAYFAEVIDGVVVRVLAIGNDDITNENGDEQESIGVALCDRMYGGGTWVQTSYNHNFRKQYASTGYSYDADKDKFIRPQPYPSWSLDENDDWKAPSYPDDFQDKSYRWHEDTTSWVEREL